MKNQRCPTRIVACFLFALSACQNQQSLQGSELHPPQGLTATELGTTERVHELGGIYLASQPQAADLELARARGIKTVIDQRKPTEERGFDERSAIAALEMAYLNPSFSRPEELSDALLDQTREHLRSAERPILVHCASGNRTGATWLAYRVLDDGLDFEAALLEAKAVGLRSPEYEARVRAYILRQK